MSIKPVMQEHIEQKMKGATVKEVIAPICCFKSCKKSADFLLSLRFTDGRTDVYALCKGDLQKIRDQHPSALERTLSQRAFFYAGI